jgi:hypothetical protein
MTRAIDKESSRSGTVVWTGFIWLRIGTSFECGNKPSCSIKCGEFVEYLRTCWLLKKDFCSMEIVKEFSSDRTCQHGVLLIAFTSDCMV